VGKSNWANDVYSQASFAGLYAVDAVLSEAEISDIVSKMYQGGDTLQACPTCAGNTCTQCLPTPTSLNPFSSVDIFDFLAFDRTKLQFLDGGSHTFDIDGNGGFSAVALVRFSGEAVAWERVFDFHNAYPGDNIILSRHDATNGLIMRILNGADWASECRIAMPGIIVPGHWLAIMTRYHASSGVLDLRVGESSASTICAVKQRNRIFTHTFIGKSSWANDLFFNGSIAGFFAVDTYLHNTQMASAMLAMRKNEDVLVNAYCKACPANTESAGGSVSVSDCECVSGSVGSPGRACSMGCDAGANIILDQVSGKYLCVPCVVGTYKPGKQHARIVLKENTAMRQVAQQNLNVCRVLLCNFRALVQISVETAP